MNQDRYDICIIGGGMVGAVLALLFNKSMPQLNVALLEAEEISSAGTIADQPSFDERSTAIAPSSVATLKLLGLWPALQTFATAIESIHVSDKGNVGLSVFDRQDNNGDSLGYVLENRAFGVVLAKALAESNINCLSPVHVKNISLKQGHARLELNKVNVNEVGSSDENEFIDCQLAVIADGANSKLRRSLGVDADQHDYQQHAIVANIISEKPHEGRAYERFTREGPMALLPLGREPQSHQSALVLTLPNDQVDQYIKYSDDDFLAALQDRFGYRLGRIEKVSVRKVYPLTRILAREQVRSNIVLMGNAAHFLHPVAGQGFNLSLRDSLRLVERIRESVDSNEDFSSLMVLQDYLERQRSDQFNTIGLSQAFVQFFKHTNKASILARTLGFLALETKPWARRLFIRQLSGRAQKESQPFNV